MLIIILYSQTSMTSKTILADGITLGVILLTGFTVTDASAAVFVKYDGIDGEATDANHDKWIDVLSLNWGSHKKVDKK